MAGLLDGLSSALSGLSAAQTGLSVVGQNMANVNTEGYSRRTVELADVPPISPDSAGRGVTVVDIRALRDVFVEARLRQEQGGSSHDSAVVNGLTGLDSIFAQPDGTLDTQISSFFDAFASLADDPTSSSARDAVVSQGQTVAASFKDMSDNLRATAASADGQIGDDVQQVNQLAAKIAKLNGQIAADGPDSDSLIDARNLALQQISQLAGVHVIDETNGNEDVTLGSGRPLVVGTTAYSLTTTAAPPNGWLAISSNGTDVTSEITGGEIGGLLQVRDTLVPSYEGRLDQMAYDLANSVNAAHATGFDAHGAAAGNFFAPPAGVAGAASSLAVAAPVVADSSLVAASGTGASGDNQTARAIAALRDAPIVAGGTMSMSDAWGQLAYHVGADISSAQSSSDTHDAVVQQLQRMRTQVSGVSLDEEAANLMKFQRAYEASARYFTTLGSTLDTLMAMVQ